MGTVGACARRLTALTFLSAAIAIAPWTAAGATSCSDGKGDAVIVGEVTDIDGSIATFRVETAKPGAHRSAGAPLPQIGASVPVFYYDDDTQFLRKGQRYHVQLWWSDERFSSDVTTAQDICKSGATRRADGSGIETSLISRPHVKQILMATLITPALVLVLLAVWLRQRRRRKASVHV